MNQVNILDNAEIAKYVFKADKSGSPHHLIAEVILTSLMKTLLNKSDIVVKQAHPVREGEKFTGVAVEKHEKFHDFNEINLINLLFPAGKEQEATVPEETNKVGESLKEQVYEFFQDNKDRKEKIAGQIAAICCARYLCCDDDLHKGNIGFTVKSDQDCQIEAIDVVPVDFDMMFYPQIISEFKVRYFQFCLLEKKFAFGADLIETIKNPPGAPPGFFPSVVTSKGRNITGNPGKYTQEDVDCFHRMMNDYKERCEGEIYKVIEHFLELKVQVGSDDEKADKVKMLVIDVVEARKDQLYECVEFNDHTKAAFDEKADKVKMLVRDVVEARKDQLYECVEFNDHTKAAFKKFHTSRMLAQKELQQTISEAEKSLNNSNIDKRINPNLMQLIESAYKKIQAAEISLSMREDHVLKMMETYVQAVQDDKQSFASLVSWWVSLRESYNIFTKKNHKSILSRYLDQPIFSPWTKLYVSFRDLLLAKGYDLDGLEDAKGSVIEQMKILKEFSSFKKPTSEYPVRFKIRVSLAVGKAVMNKYARLNPSRYWQSKSIFEKLFYPITFFCDLLKVTGIILPMLFEEVARSIARSFSKKLSTKNRAKKAIITFFYFFCRTVQMVFRVIKLTGYIVFSPVVNAANWRKWSGIKISRSAGNISGLFSLFLSFSCYFIVAKIIIAFSLLLKSTILINAASTIMTSVGLSVSPVIAIVLIIAALISAKVIVTELEKFFLQSEPGLNTPPTGTNFTIEGAYK